MDENLKAEVLATYAAYLEAFLAKDLQTLNSMMQFPLAYIGNGKSRMFDTFPFDPAELMAAKQMHTTIDANYEVVFATDKKAHLILHSATRVKKDGTPIETVSGFYALTRTDAGWKFFALSDITVPAA
jgi:hypothetical protein